MLPLLWRQYLKSSWSVAESRHQLSLRPLEDLRSEHKEAEVHKHCAVDVKMHNMDHLCTERSPCECAFPSSARSDCAHLRCRLSFLEGGRRSESESRSNEDKMKSVIPAWISHLWTWPSRPTRERAQLISLPIPQTVRAVPFDQG